MKPKNTICLWFDKDAHDAARFYAATFPDSAVAAVHKAPDDYPGGKKGEVLKATFRPQDDVIDMHPTAWCTASAGASSYGVFAASDTPNGGHFHILVSRFRFFTIS